MSETDSVARDFELELAEIDAAGVLISEALEHADGIRAGILKFADSKSAVAALIDAYKFELEILHNNEDWLLHAYGVKCAASARRIVERQRDAAAGVSPTAAPAAMAAGASSP